ncbi:hypothetical protein CBL_09982 [Carabus blaptoides fortunei]
MRMVSSEVEEKKQNFGTKMVTCGRTKSEAVIENILSPKSVEVCLLELGVKSIIRNAGNKACKALLYDMGNLILKVYAKFSNSRKKNSQPKECFEYLDMEYEIIILRHGITKK